MSARPEIRLAAAGDFDAIAAITNHWIRTTAIHFAYEDVSAAELRDKWRAHEDVFPCLVSTAAGRVLGYAKAGTWRERDAYLWTPECGIYLVPDALGRGVGKPLYARLLAVMRAQGFRSAIGGIALPNERSVRLHEALGFVHAGTVQDAGWKNGEWHAVGFWQLRFRTGAEGGVTLRSPREAFAETAGDEG